jgi:hypothetical protein
MFIMNFQGMYERPSTAETLKTIKQKHGESLWDYMKHFCNARNATSYIQDIKIINVFCDGVSDIKTIDEITIKKPKTVADLLTVANVCIEASEARARLLESRRKGPSKKKQNDREVNITDHGDCRDRGYRQNRQQQSTYQKEKDCSITLLMQRSGVKFIISQDTIWKSAKLFWIARRCHHQHRWHKNHVKVNIDEPILTMRNR